MRPQASQSTATVAPELLQRYSEVALYLLVLTGFIALASTGGLGVIAILLVGAGLAFRGYLLVSRRTLLLPPRWTTVLTLAYVVFYLADYALISREFLASTVHLVLFVMLVRLYSVRRERDGYFLAVVAFLMVLSSAMLTVSSMFLIAFTIFMLVAVATFILMEMRHACSQTTQPSRPGRSAAARAFASSLIKISPVIVLLILAGAALIFFLLPRMSAGFLSAYSPRNEIATGFSDRVELGRIGEIQQSNAVVMHIKVDSSGGAPAPLKWRGVALTEFNGHVWSNPGQRRPLWARSDGPFTLPEGWALRGVPGGARSTIHYRVLMEPMGTDVFFLAPVPISIGGQYRYLVRDDEGAVFDLDPDHPLSVYEAWSIIDRPMAVLASTPSSNGSEEIPRKYLKTPTLDPRIPRLAHQVADSSPGNYQKAVALEAYLRGHYGYTLKLSRKSPRDPLAEFLFERKQGHCEYFASAMAVMLRTLNIPSRLVNGFSGGEFNDLTSEYVIRGSDAHSWVEAYFPGRGWVSFDPTPPSAAPSHTGWGRIMLYADAVSSFWREWVVNYDTAHQQTFATAVATHGRTFVFGARRWLRHQYRHLLSLARHAQGSTLLSPWGWAIAVMLAALATLAAFNFRRVWQALVRLRLTANPQKAPKMAATLWYERMLRGMVRHGWRKLPTQTPAEFARSIDRPGVRSGVERFTQHYEAARFGDSAGDAAKLPELLDEILTASRE